MATRPSEFPDWATDNPSNRAAPSSDLRSSGWLPGQPLPAQIENYDRDLTSRWLRYFDGAQNSTVTATATEPAIRLIGGGRWSYVGGTSTLSWAEPAYIAYPGLADAANTIAAGSAVVPSGSVAYVTTNAPFVDRGDTTSGSTTVQSVTYVDQITVGWAVSGAGIPSGTTVTGRDLKAKTVTLSAAATATAAAVRLVFVGSGPLTVQVATQQAFAATANAVVIARAITAGCIVGVGSGQMRLHEQESKSLLGTGYQDVQRFTAGEALTAGQFVYMSVGASDASRTAGQVYGATAAVGVPQRAYVLGVSLYACNAGDTAYVMSEGLLPIFTGLTPGYVYYLSTATPGVPVTTAPTATGASVVQLGMAVSATSLLLGAPANRKPALISPFYQPQQVFMGTYHRAAQGTASSQDFTAFGTNAQDGKYAFRQWTTGSAGQVLKVKVNSVTGLPSNLSLRIFRGNSPGTTNDSSAMLYQAGGQPFNTLSGGGVAIQAFWVSIPVGAAPFNAFDTLGLAMSFSTTTMEVNAQAEMEVYTS